MPSRAGDRFRLGHQLAHDLRHLGMARQFLERAAGQRADRIERDVAEQLDPDLMTEPRRDRAAEAGGDQRFGNRFGALGLACRPARRS